MSRLKERLAVFLRPASVTLAACCPIFMVGCGPNGAGLDTAGIQPVMAQDDRQLAQDWYETWAGQVDAPGQDVRDLVFFLGVRGRDWRSPRGPDGYIMRVVLAGPGDKPVAAEGSLKLVLVESPGQQTARAVCSWLIEADEAKRRFRPDRLSGYVLRLDWCDGPSQQGGTFMLIVRWTSQDRTSWFTRNIVFEEQAIREMAPTTKPASGSVAGVNNVAGDTSRPSGK